MLIGFALIAVAALLCCSILIRLSINALPLFVGAFAANWVYHGEAGLLAAAITSLWIGVETGTCQGPAY